MLLSACCFGSVPPLTVLATADGTPLQTVQLWRYATSALLLGIAMYRMRRRDPAWQGAAQSDVAPRDAMRRVYPAAWQRLDLTLFGGGAQFVVAALSLSALRWLPAATAAFLFYTYPAWVTVLSAVRRIEAVTRPRLIALLLALAGVTAMVGAPGNGTLSPLGIALALGAAVVYAMYIPAMSVRQRGVAPIAAAHAVALGGTLGFLGWSVVSGALLDLPEPRVLALSITMGVLTAFAFFGFLAGLAGLGPVRAAIMSTIEPVWTAVLGLLALGQPLGMGTLFGGAGILAAVLLLQWTARR